MPRSGKHSRYAFAEITSVDASTLTVYLNTSLPSQAAPEDLMEPVDPWTPSFLSVRGCWLHGRGVCCGDVRVVFLCVCEPVRVCVGVSDGSVVSGVLGALGPNLWGIVPSCRCACALSSPMRQVHVCI